MRGDVPGDGRGWVSLASCPPNDTGHLVHAPLQFHWRSSDPVRLALGVSPSSGSKACTRDAPPPQRIKVSRSRGFIYHFFCTASVERRPDATQGAGGTLRAPHPFLRRPPHGCTRNVWSVPYIATRPSSTFHVCLIRLVPLPAPSLVPPPALPSSSPFLPFLSLPFSRLSPRRDGGVCRLPRRRPPGRPPPLRRPAVGG